MMSRRLLHLLRIVSLLLLPILLLLPSRTYSLSSSSSLPSSSSSSSSPLPRGGQRRRTAFEFAPNGVCIHPRHFVSDTTINSNQEDDNNLNNDDSEIVNGQQQQQDKRKKQRYFTMRNVPGEGDCMFLAVALAAATSMGLGGNDALLRAISRETREVVAQILESPTGNLHIAGKRIVSAVDLLKSACQQEGLNKEEYLQALRKEGRNGGLYGGGPELTVLANVLRRPISIYELDRKQIQQQKNDNLSSEAAISTNGENNNCNDDDICRIVCKGSFGEGLFEDPCASIPDSAVLSGIQPGAYSWQLHILVLDISNGEKHACVLLPENPL